LQKREDEPQIIFPVGRKKNSEEDDGGRQEGGAVLRNTLDEGSGPDNRSNHEYAKQATGVPVEIRMKTGINLQCSLDAEEIITGSRCETC